MDERFEIRSEAAAAVFAAPRSRRVLLALAGRERSLRDLAGLTGLRLNLLHYHVGRLIRLGLAGIVREERRPGRPIKYYRAVAPAFFVPSHLLGDGVGERLAAELRDCLAEARARDGSDGTLFYWDGGPRMRRIGGDEAGAAELWWVLDLTDREAAALAAEMKALLARYAGREQDGGRTYLAHAALARR